MGLLADLGFYLHGITYTLLLAVVVAAWRTTKRRPVRTTLDSGAWIEHVPVQGLTARHYRDWQRLGVNITEDAVGDDGEVDVRALVTGIDIGMQNLDKTSALFGILISGWSYELPVPKFDRPSGQTSNTESIEELPGDDYRQIFLLLEPFREKLDIKPNPKAPAAATTTSSNGSSRGRASASRGG